ncbi:hypothetical protein PGT21_050309 [Puccinia graminis f. sp. tritici]|uniref:Uncharacterized protein n=1 Tax=Puccinia graminis f. sp. tritici TaxID=56615 RepID=A0A5B0MI31_PUCGR|nr:hypothetical protein PGT21_050309 [Puccinia graminis f. sp. tritici]
MPPKRTIPQPAPPTPVANATQSKKKKTPVLWDKDGTDGFTSIRILLDWLAVEGNYQRWRGDTKSGSTKAALANEILSLMADCGITHRDNKGVQTKIQELQNAYSKASDFLRNTGSGLQEEDLANGTKTLEMALVKICKYWDELHPIMATRTVASPLHTTESTSFDIPNLLDRQGLDELPDDDLATLTTVSEANAHTSEAADVADNEEEPDPEPVERTKTTAPSSGLSGKKKRKPSSKSTDPLGLEKVLSDANEYRRNCYEARKERDKDKKAAEKSKMESDKKRIKLEAARDRTMIDVERRKIKLAEIEAQMKVREFESNEIDKRIKNMADLKALGHSTEEIKEFFAAQFNRGPGGGSSNPAGSSSKTQQIVELLSDSDNNSTGGSSDSSGVDD